MKELIAELVAIINGAGSSVELNLSAATAANARATGLRQPVAVRDYSKRAGSNGDSTGKTLHDALPAMSAKAEQLIPFEDGDMTGL
jgi:hypothetical protein